MPPCSICVSVASRCEAEAKTLLQQAFVGEVVDRIDLQPLRDRLHHLVDMRFRGRLSKCEGCGLCK